MADKGDFQAFIPLCREESHVQRERVRSASQTLSQTDIEFLRDLKVKS